MKAALGGKSAFTSNHLPPTKNVHLLYKNSNSVLPKKENQPVRSEFRAESRSKILFCNQDIQATLKQRIKELEKLNSNLKGERDAIHLEKTKETKKRTDETTKLREIISELQTDKTRLQAAVKTLSKSIISERDKSKDIESSKKEKENENEILKAEIEAMKEENQTCKSKIADLEKTNEESKKRTFEAEKRVNELQRIQKKSRQLRYEVDSQKIKAEALVKAKTQELLKQTKETEKIRLQVSSLEVNSSISQLPLWIYELQLKTALGKHKESLAKAESEWSEKYQSLTAECESKKKECASYEESLRCANQNVSTLSKKELEMKRKLLGKVAELKETNDKKFQLNQKYIATKTELESLKQRLKQAETAKKNMETLRIQLDKATLEIETLRTDAGKMDESSKAQIKSQKEQIRTLQKKLERVKQSSRQRDQRELEWKDKASTLSEQVKQLESDRKNGGHDLSQVSEELREKTDALQAIEKKLEEQTESNGRLQEALQSLSKEIAKLKQVEQANNKLKKENEELQDRFEEYKSQLDEKEDEVQILTRYKKQRDEFKMQADQSRDLRSELKALRAELDEMKTREKLTETLKTLCSAMKLQSEDEALLREYQKFMCLKYICEDFQSNELQPSACVKSVWTDHIAHRIDYVKSHQEAFGTICLHNPTLPYNEECFQRTLKEYKHWFKDTPPSTYWQSADVKKMKIPKKKDAAPPTCYYCDSSEPLTMDSSDHMICRKCALEQASGHCDDPDEESDTSDKSSPDHETGKKRKAESEEVTQPPKRAKPSPKEGSKKSRFTVVQGVSKSRQEKFKNIEQTSDGKWFGFYSHKGKVICTGSHHDPLIVAKILNGHCKLLHVRLPNPSAGF